MPKPLRPTRPSRHSSQAPHTFELVELRWILKALGTVLALAVVCGYILLCVVYSRTQWQIVLHPSRDVSKTPAAIGLAFEEVHFGVDSSGQPQLDGWWLPSDLTSDPTVLVLRSGDGSMSDSLQGAKALHDARLNVLLFDYRGFGHSGGRHPTQSTMQTDAESAFAYLTDVRQVSPANIVVYGKGVGASLAVRLCAEHPQLASLILIDPAGDLKLQAVRQAGALFPARLLFTQDFPLAQPLQTLATPKLLISTTGGYAPPVFQRAADPKMTVELPANDPAGFQQALRRFLDTYVSAHPNP